ncbi:MAG TPA: hypothetical protein VGS01_08230 [Candidatus Limnocylindria bacterium]|jgi:hypothetical protein|nr:hypothetical protein [Candidatus Limnocylindria bacterium]
MDKILFSVDDVVAFAPIGRIQVFELLRSGERQRIKVGRRRLVPMRAVEAWVATRMTNETRTGPALTNEDGPNQASERGN